MSSASTKQNPGRGLQRSDYISLCAVLVSAASFFWSILQNDRTDKAAYIAQSVANWPKLNLVGEPTIDDGKVHLSTGPNHPKEVYYDTLLALAHLRVSNSGTMPAVVLAQMQMEAPTGEPLLRNLLLGKPVYNPLIVKVESSATFFRELQVAPSETTQFSLSIYAPVRPNLDSTAYHFMIVYRDAAGHLYDFYYQARVVYPPPHFVVLPSTSAPLHIAYSNTTRYPYSRDEARVALRYLKGLDLAGKPK